MEIKIKDNKIYAPLKDKWLVLKPEEEVRQKYIARLVESYGYSYDQMEQEKQVTNSQRGQGAARADIVIWKNAKDKVEKKYPLIVVECKAESISIRKEDNIARKLKTLYRNLDKIEAMKENSTSFSKPQSTKNICTFLHKEIKKLQ